MWGRIFYTINITRIIVPNGLQDCISTYAHNKTPIVGKFASVYICKGT